MKISIMQPYFFPYIGYFSLIKATDKFISFDTAQYIRHGWINRNRILKHGGGWQYIVVPLVKHSRSSSICDVKIANYQGWSSLIIKQIEHYKKIAPFYKDVYDLVKCCLENQFTSIADLNIYTLEKICSYLNIQFEYEVFSEMNIIIDEVEHPGQWALNISKKVGATEYINPIGGSDIFNNSEFINEGIELKYLKQNNNYYNQRNYDFIENLSIIDFLMFNAPPDITAMLENIEIINPSLHNHD